MPFGVASGLPSPGVMNCSFLATSPGRRRSGRRRARRSRHGSRGGGRERPRVAQHADTCRHVRTRRTRGPRSSTAMPIAVPMVVSRMQNSTSVFEIERREPDDRARRPPDRSRCCRSRWSRPGRRSALRIRTCRGPCPSAGTSGRAGRAAWPKVEPILSPRRRNTPHPAGGSGWFVSSPATNRFRSRKHTWPLMSNPFGIGVAVAHDRLRPERGCTGVGVELVALRTEDDRRWPAPPSRRPAALPVARGTAHEAEHRSRRPSPSGDGARDRAARPRWRCGARAPAGDGPAGAPAPRARPRCRTSRRG